MTATTYTTFGPDRRDGLTVMTGGVTAARGFRAAGVTAGLKPSGKPDLALVHADSPATCAAVTTTNQVKAAPCRVTDRNAADGRARTVVVNSGNANACTGADGLADAETMTEATADALDLSPTDVLVCSTGIIGVPLEMPPVLTGIADAAARLDRSAGGAAAEAILTTDAGSKQSAYRVDDGNGTCIVGGMAKGAGMIEPAMATMLAVITTDAPFEPAVLRSVVREVVGRTFNRISVDGCGSTNDTVVVLANGSAEAPPGLEAFRRGLEAVCADLARAIVADGEGATKVAEIRVRGARSDSDAEDLARSIAGSVLVRAALHGADPNWGRVLAAMGASSISFDPDRVSVRFGPAGQPDAAVTVCRFGVATAFDAGQAAAALARRDVAITVGLDLGPGEATFLTADLTPEYVHFNSAYTT